MKKEYPIVFIHVGNSDYLPFVFNQAKKTNPEAEIVLIGDQENNQYNSVSHVLLSEYSKSEERLSSAYVHLSKHPYKYEFFCMKRWFILLERMRDNEQENCFYMDSDVLLFSNIIKEKEVWKDFDLAYTTISGHTIFINSRKALEDFCNFIIDQYTHHISEITADYNFINTVDSHRGISDMYMFNKYRGLYPSKIGNIQNSSIAVFDGFISHKEGYDSFAGIKSIVFKDGTPYGKKNGTLIKFNSLHLQGHIKYLLIEHYINQDVGVFFKIKVFFIQFILMPYIMPIRGYLINKLHLHKKSNII